MSSGSPLATLSSLLIKISRILPGIGAFNLF